MEPTFDLPYTGTDADERWAENQRTVFFKLCLRGISMTVANQVIDLYRSRRFPKSQCDKIGIAEWGNTRRLVLSHCGDKT